MVDLHHRVAIVTGGARGIGRAYAEALAGSGAAVLIVDLLESEGRATADSIVAAGGRASFRSVDIAEVGATVAMADAAAQLFGGIDILVNNAAKFADLQGGGFDAITPERWDRTMAVNVKGPWLCARAVVPHMRARGGGSIVNQSSIAAFGLPYMLDYGTSKAALIGLTKNLALELGRDDIRVNAIAPGGVTTQAAAGHLGGDVSVMAERAVANQAIGRAIEPADLVDTMLYLASDASRLVTGQTVVVDGGRFLLG